MPKSKEQKQREAQVRKIIYDHLNLEQKIASAIVGGGKRQIKLLTLKKEGAK